MSSETHVYMKDDSCDHIDIVGDYRVSIGVPDTRNEQVEIRVQKRSKDYGYSAEEVIERLKLRLEYDGYTVRQGDDFLALPTGDLNPLLIKQVDATRYIFDSDFISSVMSSIQKTLELPTESVHLEERVTPVPPTRRK